MGLQLKAQPPLQAVRAIAKTVGILSELIGVDAMARKSLRVQGAATRVGHNPFVNYSCVD
jgi:hypothetical protein